MNIIIKEYTLIDKVPILNLLKLNTPKYFAPEEEKDFIHYLDHAIDLYYVMKLDNQIVGCGGINFKDETIGVISWGIIHPDFQRMSLGSVLLKYRVQELLKFEKFEKIIVRTSQLVFPFFEKNGFTIVQTIDNYWAEGFHLYEMEYTN